MNQCSPNVSAPCTTHHHAMMDKWPQLVDILTDHRGWAPLGPHWLEMRTCRRCGAPLSYDARAIARRGLHVVLVAGRPHLAAVLP